MGNTQTGTQKILDKFVQLKLANIRFKYGKRQFTFRPDTFLSDTKDLVGAVEGSFSNQMSAGLEYIDLKEFADLMNINPLHLLDSVIAGRISLDAVVLKQSVVRRNIEEQGRHFF